jgi:triacylglycerol esterase/lipase EstA (alpha/beta hydrolase family)
MKHHLRLAAALAVAVTLTLTTAATADAAASPRSIRISANSEINNFFEALPASQANPARQPDGANDWNCRPSAAHPEPVILLHGTWESAFDNWQGLSPILKAAGYCVFAPNYGDAIGWGWVNATADLLQSAQEIAAYVARVRAATGAQHVALVGHSQGGAQARYYANVLAPAGEVTKVIMITPTNHATTLSGLATLRNLLGLNWLTDAAFDLVRMPGANQQSYNSSPFYVRLNGSGETVPGIAYTVIATRYDEIATPYATTGFITAGPGATVDNITLQNVCPLDLSEHLSASYSKNVAQIVLNKLDPTDVRPIKCYYQAALTGSTASHGLY